MQHSTETIEILEKVNKIGMELEQYRGFEFVVLAPHLDKLTGLLKSIGTNGITAIFIKYAGVKNVMSMIEDEAQKMEKELGLI